jgi:hypothetical protein
LDRAVVGIELAPHEPAVVVGRAMQMLIAVVASSRLHVHHPEVIGVGTDGVQGLF